MALIIYDAAVGGCMNTFTHVPPGFRFHPTDEELVGYYLRRKVAARTIDLDIIKDIDLYKIEPWDLQEQCRRGIEEQDDWYFFSHKDKKYPSGTRTNRATAAGFWKATGRDKAIYSRYSLMGMRKTLVYYRGRAPNGQKSDWIMHEYRLETTENDTQQEEGWVVCRVFRKKMPATTMVLNQLDCSYSRCNDYMMQQQLEIPRSVLPYTDHVVDIHNPMAVAYPCKQEVEEYYNQLQYHLPLPDPFQHLPQLESPKLEIPISGFGSQLNASPLHCQEQQLQESNHGQIHCQEQQLQESNHGQIHQNMNCDRQDWQLLNEVVDAQLSNELEYVPKEDGEDYPAANSYQFIL